ncbi:type II secretion system protein [candidate division WWE3 bacterium]|uniref:Type II secretion system protein n=1 Tax=candidate division WWE3 bacterium TaxID=2053526 RepID=A0A955LVB0_UNCKA|nr:type II secretion system protein [candidate division WWE3 bacterium]
MKTVILFVGMQLEKISNKGFTLIELLVVMVVTFASLTATWISIRYALDKGNVAEAIAYAKLIADSSDLYLTDMDFYPPDVNRGCDPGFVQKDPTKEPGGWDCETKAYVPAYHPSDWQNIVDERWLGPYLKVWNTQTPWGGKYDYNFWPDGAVRNGECLAPGVYIGVQGDYDGNNEIPAHAEERMIELGVDEDLKINGEAQLFIQTYESANPVCDAGVPTNEEAGAEAIPEPEEEVEEFTCPENRLLVCHKAGTPNETNKCVTSSSYNAHINHGDTAGACGS